MDGLKPTSQWKLWRWASHHFQCSTHLFKAPAKLRSSEVPFGFIWVCLKIVYPYTQWLMIIIPIKWLFHWEYTQHFQTNPFFSCDSLRFIDFIGHSMAGQGACWPWCNGILSTLLVDAQIIHPEMLILIGLMGTSKHTYSRYSYMIIDY